MSAHPYRAATLTAPAVRWRVVWERPRFDLLARLALYFATSCVAQTAVMHGIGADARAQRVAFAVGLAAQFACQAAARLRREVTT